MNNIPYGHQTIDFSDIEAIQNVLVSDWLTTGPKVPEFEQKISNYIGCNNSIVVNSGTSALDIAIQSLALPKGSEVITTPFTFAATNNSLLYHDLKPIFTDIRTETRNIDPEQIRKKISPNTKAIMIVDYAGHPCEIAEINEIAQENNFWLIEDACHAFGAEYSGKKVGRFADMTIFSFHPVKPITTGEGGAVVTNNDELANKMRLLGNHGIDKDSRGQFNFNSEWAYDMVELGRNYRMNDIQAALGISQLKKIETFIEKRRVKAELYNSLLEEVSFVKTPETMEDVIHGWHLYTILLSNIDRDKFFSFMRKKNIGVNVHYIPNYHLKYYREKIPTNKKNFPITEEVFSKIITLPLYPDLRNEEIEFIVKNLKKAYQIMT